MLLARSRFNRRNDLALNTKLGKGVKRSETGRLKIAYGFIQADHALLHNVLMICADQKIAARLGTNKILVLIEKEGQRLTVA